MRLRLFHCLKFFYFLSWRKIKLLRMIVIFLHFLLLKYLYKITSTKNWWVQYINYSGFHEYLTKKHIINHHYRKVLYWFSLRFINQKTKFFIRNTKKKFRLMRDICYKFFPYQTNPAFWILSIQILSHGFAKFLLIDILYFKCFAYNFCNLIFELKSHIWLSYSQSIEFI